MWNKNAFILSEVQKTCPFIHYRRGSSDFIVIPQKWSEVAAALTVEHLQR